MSMKPEKPGHAAEAYLPRRGFLRGLASLPLIGGGVALIGQPTAAAEPVTPALINRYAAWLACEHAEALVEREAILYPEHQHRMADRREWVHQPLYWFPDDPVARSNVLTTKPSTRAAIVLSAIGCDWRAS